MWAQYKLALKTRFPMRITMFSLLLIGNILFAICGRFGMYEEVGKITAVSLSSFFFFAWMITSIIADYEVINGLFSSPKGYYSFLVPIESFKILLGRILAILTWNVPGFIIGSMGITIQSLLLAKFPVREVIMREQEPKIIELVYYLVLGILQYTFFLLIIFFGVTMIKSVFYSLKGKALLGIAMSIIVYYISNFIYLVLLPFTEVTRRGIAIQLQISSGNYLVAIIYLLLICGKSIFLFYITTNLMERRLNI